MTARSNTSLHQRLSASSLRSEVGPGVIGFLAKAHSALALCVIAGLAIAVATVVVGKGTGFEDRESGTPLLQSIGLVVYLPTLLFLIAKPDLPIRTVAQGWLIMLLQTLILVSPLWAVEPDGSLRRALALSVEMIFILHAATFFTPREFIRLMGYVFAALMLASLLAVAVPGFGITPNGTHAGRMRGIFTNKNMLGEVASVAILCFVILAVTAQARSRERLIWIGLAIMTLAEVLLANSRTPLIALAGALAAVWAAAFLHFPRGWQRSLSRSVRASIVGIGALFATIILPVAATLIITALGRTMTLSGRTKLWEYAIGKGWDRPWVGAGYKSFWNDKLTFDLRVLHEHWSTEPGSKALTANAHNGYIDIWLELGFIGLAIALLLFFIFGTKAIAAIRETGDKIYLWHVGALAFALVYYLTESEVMGYNSLAWFLVAYGFLSLCAREVRAR